MDISVFQQGNEEEGGILYHSCAAYSITVAGLFLYQEAFVKRKNGIGK
jgi:hypothetical protein